MPISREPQVSDLGFCDRETANLGLAQHSPSQPNTMSSSTPEVVNPNQPRTASSTTRVVNPAEAATNPATAGTSTCRHPRIG